jgi:hypothetical protein
MKTHAAFAASAAALLMLAAAAATTAATAADKPGKPVVRNECFWTRNVNGFAAPDNRTVYVRVNSHDVFRLDLMVPCLDVDWNQRIALVSRGGSNICSGMDAEIVTHATGLGRQRCPVRQIQKLTPQEIAALPKRARP